MAADEPAETQATPSTEGDQPGRPYAILRIKRKRNEEPLDGLLVDQDVSRPTRKRSRAGLNFFKFAETVEQGAWEDEKSKEALEARLATLARESRQEQEKERPLSTSKSAPVDLQTPGGDDDEASVAAPPPPAKRPRLPDENVRTYTILKRKPPSTDPRPTRRVPTAPPKVWSTKELEALREAQARLAVYEAVPSSAGVAVLGSVDPEVAKFLPLLQDYLRLNDSGPSLIPPTATAEDETDYVYDVFYQRLAHDPSLTTGNIGTLTDVPDELILYDSDDSDSEVYDTADEDSNAEDWYQNDYPDEESDPDSSEGNDAFHESSDYEDVMHDDDEEHDWR